MSDLPRDPQRQNTFPFSPVMPPGLPTPIRQTTSPPTVPDRSTRIQDDGLDSPLDSGLAPRKLRGLDTSGAVKIKRDRPKDKGDADQKGNAPKNNPSSGNAPKSKASEDES